MKLSVTKKADRAAMAKIVFDILAASTNIGRLEIEEQPFGDISPRCTRIEFEHGRGIGVFIEFDGDSSLDREGKFCMPWCTVLNTDACLSEAFGRAVGGSINPHHYGKCTTFSDSFDDLCNILRHAVECLDSGAAYDAEREAAKIAEEGTWQERAARFEQWRVEWQAELAARKAA